MRKINTKMSAVALSVLSAITIATGASARTCTSTCSGADPTTIGAGSIAQAASTPIAASNSGGIADSSLLAIRRPDEPRGPGIWTY